MRIHEVASSRASSCPLKPPLSTRQHAETGPELSFAMATELSRRQWVGFAVDVLRTWRGITFRQWAWTTGIALVLVLAYALGVLPPLLSMVRNVRGPRPSVLTVGQF